jgi:hypothetical protein
LVFKPIFFLSLYNSSQSKFTVKDIYMKKLPILLLIFSFTVPALTQDADNCKVQATTSPVILSGSAMLRSAPIIEIRSKSSVGELYNNGIEAGGSGTGGFVTSPGGGPSGSDLSEVANVSLGLSTLGVSFLATSVYSVADDFIIPANTTWSIDSIVVFGYQTGSSTTSTLNDLRLQFWDDVPTGAGSVIYGDLTTNVLDHTYWTGVYRVTETVVDVNRPIMALCMVFSTPLNLDAGTYWIEYSAGGTLASGPWANPISIVASATTGNSLRNLNGTWSDFLDGGTATAQGLPFVIYGTSTNYYTVTFNDLINGTLAVKVDDVDITSGDMVEEGKNIEFTATPVIGFRVKAWKVNSVVVTDYSELTYTLENLSADVSVTVEFERSPEEELFNNGISAGGSGIGGFVSDPDGGFDGHEISVAENTTLGMTTYGFNMHASEFSVADDFTIPARTFWTIESFVLYGYQTNSTTSSTFTDFRVQIWEGAPNDGGTVIFGDLVTNMLTHTSWTGVYRVYETNLLNATRPIMMIHAELPDPLVLNEGTYWIEIMSDGSLASGPYTPPITIPGETSTGNALQYTVSTTTWQDVLESSTAAHQGVPFVLYGLATQLFNVSFNVVGGHGTLTAEVDAAQINSGDLIEAEKNIVFTANPANGYGIKEWKVNGVVISGTGETFMLGNLSGDVTVTVEFEPVTSTEAPVTNVLQVYPNPFNEKIIIENASGLNRIIVTDILGNNVLVTEAENSGYYILLTHKLMKGAYIVTCYMNDGDYITRLMIKN